MHYAIHADIYPNVEKKLNRIARKCARFGNDFIFNVDGEEIREEKKGEDVIAYHKFIIVDVEGTAKVNDWEFIATLDIHKGGNVIRRCNNDVEIPERFKSSDNICEHCNSKRRRKRLFVIHNTETGEFKQVGGNCLSVYTHGLDMELVVSWLDGITELENCDGVFYEHATTYYSIEDILHHANVIINKMGYLKAYPDSLSTKELVSIMLRRDVYANTISKRVELLNRLLCSNLYDIRFTIEDFKVDDYAEVESIIDYYKSMDDNSEFNHNVKIMLEEGYVPYKYIGYLCYLPQGYAKHIEREAERAKRKQLKHIHFGEVGKRYKKITVKDVRRVAVYETMYGIMNVYQIVIEGDIVLTWKTNKYIEDEVNTISFTVKNHGEYKGVDQTEVTRCIIA